MAKHVLKGWLTDNPLTADDKNDKYLILDVARSLNEDNLLDLMVKKNPGIRREIMQSCISLYKEVIAEEVCDGNSVNTGLCRFVAQFKGTVRHNTWDKEHNSIYVSIREGKELLAQISDTTVKILGERTGSYISAGEDASTHAQDFSATAGRNYTLMGKNLKIVGDDPSVGITLTDSKGKTTRLTSDRIALNSPAKLVILLPDGLDNDEYTLTLTTQYVSGRVSNNLRVLTQTLYIGVTPSQEPV
ncbi:MAG: DUF4469 domain-containing protein [Prevotellaceae bacterium]|jgi:hypothetical protein|nr:DUF4469 domain-containing protein [Prevotellaceae bacterium]